jgi:hypothetical protein
MGNLYKTLFSISCASDRYADTDYEHKVSLTVEELYEELSTTASRHSYFSPLFINVRHWVDCADNTSSCGQKNFSAFWGCVFAGKRVWVPQILCISSSSTKEFWSLICICTPQMLLPRPSPQLCEYFSPRRSGWSTVGEAVTCTRRWFCNWRIARRGKKS